MIRKRVVGIEFKPYHWNIAWINQGSYQEISPTDVRDIGDVS